jgi:flagellar hook-associated protein 2
MSDPIRIGGFFSSFDTEAVIQKLTEARLIRARRLDVERARADVRGQLIANINTQLTTLLAKAQGLTNASSVLGKIATVAGDAVTASALPSASLGSFTIGVNKLATATKVTGAAISDGIDLTSPMSKSNFATAPTNGKFTIATATGGTASIVVGPQAANSAVLLDSSNFETAVTSGSFTIATTGGGSALINVDTATQSLDDIVTAINGSGVGVTATLTNDDNGRANILTLTSSNGDITLGDAADTSNFLTATKLAGATGTATLASTAAFTQQETLASVVSSINAAGLGITAAITNDANGRPNILSFTSSQGAISLGNATDTSNFLSATNLLASPGTATRESTLSMARLNPSEKMVDALFFGGPPAAGDQSFTINGVQISYNIADDSLNDVLTRINSSGAGVTARYDMASDAILLEQNVNGSMAITLADDGAGDFLAKTGLLAATQAMGDNAEYSLNGGAVQYSATNAIVPVTGVSLTLVKTTAAGSPETVTIGQDAPTSAKAVKAFVDQFNAVLNAIDEATAVNIDDLGNSGELSKDATLRQVKSLLRGLVVGPALNVNSAFKNLNEIGVGFGSFGSAVGTTNRLQFDEAKFTAALKKDAASVQSLLSTFTLEASLEAGGTGSISSISGAYTGTRAGTYTLTDNGAGLLIADFVPLDGTAPTQATASVTANGTDTTLIPGVSIQMAGVLQAGTHTVAVTNTASSPIAQIREILKMQTATGGVMQKRQETYQAVSKDIAARIAQIEKSVEKEMEILRRKFIVMEQAQARASSIFSQLDQMMSQLTAAKRK